MELIDSYSHLYSPHLQRQVILVSSEDKQKTSRACCIYYRPLCGPGCAVGLLCVCVCPRDYNLSLKYLAHLHVDSVSDGDLRSVSFMTNDP